MKEAITQAEGSKVAEHQEEGIIHQAKILTETEKTQIDEEKDLPAQEMTVIVGKIGWTEEAQENVLLKGTHMGMQHHFTMKISNFQLYRNFCAVK